MQGTALRHYTLSTYHGGVLPEQYTNSAFLWERLEYWTKIQHDFIARYGDGNNELQKVNAHYIDKYCDLIMEEGYVCKEVTSRRIIVR